MRIMLTGAFMVLLACVQAQAQSYIDCERGKNSAACDIIIRVFNPHDSLESKALVDQAICIKARNEQNIVAVKESCHNETYYQVEWERKSPRQ